MISGKRHFCWVKCILGGLLSPHLEHHLVPLYQREGRNLYGQYLQNQTTHIKTMQTDKYYYEDEVNCPFNLQLVCTHRQTQTFIHLTMETHRGELLYLQLQRVSEHVWWQCSLTHFFTVQVVQTFKLISSTLQFSPFPQKSQFVLQLMIIFVIH